VYFWILTTTYGIYLTIFTTITITIKTKNTAKHTPNNILHGALQIRFLGWWSMVEHGGDSFMVLHHDLSLIIKGETQSGGAWWR